MMRWVNEIEDAAVVAGQPADDDAENEADGNAEQADRERDAGAIDDARQHIATQPVGAEQEQLAVLGRTEEMKIPLEQAPEAIAVATAEEADPLHVVGIVGVLALEIVHVEPHRAAVHERADEARRRERSARPAAACR